jgi:hypothetical protein
MAGRAAAAKSFAVAGCALRDAANESSGPGQQSSGLARVGALPALALDAGLWMFEDGTSFALGEGRRYETSRPRSPGGKHPPHAAGEPKAAGIAVFGSECRSVRIE